MDQSSLPLDPTIAGLALDSRKIKPGFLFAAVSGSQADGANFVADAVKRGATAILAAPDATLPPIGADVAVVRDVNPRRRIALMAASFAGLQPATIAAVTGTNGKTTTTHGIAAVADAVAVPTAILGTLGVRFRDIATASGRTTPEAPELHAALQAVAESGAEVAAMEVSSHALALHRVDGLRFEVAVFLGLSQDHLDFHHTMREYFEAKARLFDARVSRRAVINIDDAWGRELATRAAIPHVTYAVSTEADWTARDVAVGADGNTSFTLEMAASRRLGTPDAA